jgi:hypothetical protein
MKKSKKKNVLIYLLPGLKQVRQQQESELPGHPGIKNKLQKSIFVLFCLLLSKGRRVCMYCCQANLYLRGGPEHQIILHRKSHLTT